MTRGILFVIFLMVSVMLNGCSWASDVPEAMITLRVQDESGNVIENAEVRVGFESPGNGENSNYEVKGVTDAEGLISAKSRTVQDIGYHVTKNGYYESYGQYRFMSKENHRWQPWNQEFKVVLRKIENPVPMYAIDLHKSKMLELPKTGTEIGFDLIERDWIAPYGKGMQADLIFKADRKFMSNQEYDGTLTVTFANKYDGIILHKENRINGSYFKLPRYAPEDGYKTSLTATVRSLPGQPPTSTFSDDNNFLFRIRSEEKDGKFYRAMYGKIHGDFIFGLIGTKTADLAFKYYLNPDYTRNLEFDPKRNLFKNLEKSDYVGTK